MRKRSLWVLLLAALLIAGAAAGVFAQKKTDITVWCMAFDPHVNGFTNVIEAFNQANPSIRVTLEPQPGQAEMTAKIRAALAAGRSEAQGFTTTGTTVFEFATTGTIQPVSPGVVTVEQVKKNFLPENYLQCHKDNAIWAIGIPDPPGDCGILFNADHLQEAGLAIPTKFDSTDQLLEYAGKLAKYGEDGKLVRAGLSFQESNDPNYVYSYIAEIGGKFWDNSKQKFTLQTPQAKQVMQFFYNLFFKDKVDATNLPDTLSALSQNLASMGFMWPEFLPMAESLYPDLNLGFAMKPPFKKGNLPIFSHTDTWNMVVPKYVSGAEKDATFKFLQFLISEEGQLLFLDANPGLSPLKSLVFKNDYYKTGKGKYLAPVIAAMLKGQYRYWGPFADADVMLYNINWPNIDAMIHGQLTVDQMLAKSEKELNEQDARTRAKYPDAPKTIIDYSGLPADLKL
jgi:ABC-type glycerol-3-phosphate transport system substrate-binding protein